MYSFDWIIYLENFQEEVSPTSCTIPRLIDQQEANEFFFLKVR